jgi:hypothetical protein
VCLIGYPVLYALHLQIAAALDRILAKKLDDATAAAADAAAAPADVDYATPEPIPNNAAAEQQDEDLLGVRLFRRVAPGTPCVIKSNEYGLQQQHGAADPDQLHLHPGCERKPVQEVIPRLNLAAISAASKKRHAKVLKELTVDGAALLAAAAAGDTAWRAADPQQQQQQQQDGQKAAKAAGQQKKKKLKVEGIVVEAKQFVPHHDRMVKLLGAAAAVR